MKITKHIPNTITSMNLLCGIIAVIFSFEGRLDLAFYLMLAAAVCDFFDGMAARALGAYSDIGKELDSLADMVSFGLLPSIMLYNLSVQLGGSDIWAYIPLVITVFSALRLAKFNTDDRQHDNFIGLATPACALLCGALAHYVYCTPDSFMTVWAGSKLFLPISALVLSGLLVSELPMFSLKFKKGQAKGIIHSLRYGFIGLCIAEALIVFLVGQQFSLIFIMAVLTYLIMNIINDIATVRANRRRAQQ